MKTLAFLALSVVACGAPAPGFDSSNPDPQQNGGTTNGTPGTNAAVLADLVKAFDYACPTATFGGMRDVNKDGRPDFVMGCDGKPTVRIS